MNSVPFFRSLLFTPGVRFDLFAKALASEADLVCLDLEDSVPSSDKQTARDAVMAFLINGGAEDRLAIRINPVTTREGLLDLTALSRLAAPPRLVLLPKVESATELRVARGAFPDGVPGFMALIESVDGLARANDIVLHPDCIGLMFGGADFAADMGAPVSWDLCFQARSQIAYACARKSAIALDMPWLDIRDEVGHSVMLPRIRGLGFSGQAAIHPNQVARINEAFTPSSSEVEMARAAIDAFKQSGGVAQMQGRLLEAPTIRLYERVLAAAECANRKAAKSEQQGSQEPYEHDVPYT